MSTAILVCPNCSDRVHVDLSALGVSEQFARLNGVEAQCPSCTMHFRGFPLGAGNLAATGPKQNLAGGGSGRTGEVTGPNTTTRPFPMPGALPSSSGAGARQNLISGSRAAAGLWPKYTIPSEGFSTCPHCGSQATLIGPSYVGDGVSLSEFACPSCNNRFVSEVVGGAAGHAEHNAAGRGNSNVLAGRGRGPQQLLINERSISAAYVATMPPSAVIAGLVSRCYAPGRPDSEVYAVIDALKAAGEMVDQLENAAVDYELRSLSNPPPNEVSGATPIGRGSGATPSPGADSLVCPNCGSPASLVGQTFVSEGVDQSPLAACEACGYQFIATPQQLVSAARGAERNANGRGNSNLSRGSGPKQPILNSRRDLSIASKFLAGMSPKLLVGQLVAAAYDEPARLAPTVYALKQAGEAATMLEDAALASEAQQLLAVG